MKVSRVHAETTSGWANLCLSMSDFFNFVQECKVHGRKVVWCSRPFTTLCGHCYSSGLHQTSKADFEGDIYICTSIQSTPGQERPYISYQSGEIWLYDNLYLQDFNYIL